MSIAGTAGGGHAARWGSWIFGRRLGTRIARTASMLTLAFVLALGSLCYSVVRTHMVRSAQVAVEHEAALLADHVGNVLTAVVETMRPLAGYALVLNALMDSFTRQTALIPFLEDLSTVNGLPINIVLTEFEGNPVAGAGFLARDHDDWQSTVLERGEIFVAIREGPRGPALFVAEPVVYPMTPGPEGALIYQLALDDVLRPTGPRDGDDRRIALLHRHGMLLSHGGSGESAPEGALRRVQALKVPDVLEPLGLAVEITVPGEIVARPLGRLFNVYALIAAVLVALVIALSVVAARVLSRPLRDLEKVASSVIDAGSLETRFPVHGSSETARLGIAFNRMLERLAVTYQELERLVASERERGEELARRAEELARSNAELERFAYVASHDLQEPLRKVRAFGGLLRSELGDELSQTASDYLARMHGACERMQGLIDDLLLFSKVSNPRTRPERIALEEIVQGVVLDLEVQLARTGGQVDAGGLPCVSADRVHMRQLFQNLIGNSIKYRRPEVEPRIIVRARAVAPDDGAPGLWELSVEDNGIGFEQEYAERVFGVFQRLHSRHEYEGTGIGLAICRKIVEHYGGAITAHSVPGQGTTINFTLPAAHEAVSGADGGAPGR